MKIYILDTFNLNLWERGGIPILLAIRGGAAPYPPPIHLTHPSRWCPLPLYAAPTYPTYPIAILNVW